MSTPVWRWVSASVIGTAHIAVGAPCQDSHLCHEIQTDKGPVLLALASDGAGSAAKSAIGSRMVCEVLRDRALEFFREEGEVGQINLRLIGNWIQSFRDELIFQADSDGVSDREYACTLLGVIAGSDATALFQVGDGAIVYSHPSDLSYSLAFWPDRGEYENTTYFVTQATFLDQLQFSLIQAPIWNIALFSDGLQRLALNYKDRTAHTPFFDGLFAPLKSSDINSLPALNVQLETFLRSNKIAQRTDDDKTIILATALPVPPPAKEPLP
jgi:Protein phosphatase 2C